MNRLRIGLVLVALSCVGLAVAQDQKAPARTLDAVTIEGAVDVPQVLFITSRENVRFDDGLGWSFLKAATDSLAPPVLPVRFSPFVFESEPTPSVVPVAADTAALAAKEK